ncbi:c-type cytochrome [Symmachiella dynata]|uniref:c-type cytochrome n=1 Tax=Symmachiella dynata TaxID=2527995 RepID=UPI0030EECA36
MRNSRTVFVAITAFVLTTATAYCHAAETDGPAPPFVAGFDRFARHGDITPLTASQLLFSELSCTACHAATDNHLQPKRGPRLNGIADRIDPDWIKQFLAAPQTVKPGTTMPDVLAGLKAADKQQAIAALSAYLATQHQAFPEIKAGGGNPVPHEFWNKGNAQRGKQLYHQVGCVACHQPDADYEVAEIKPSAIDEILDQLDPEELSELGLASAARRVESVPHGDLPAKYTPKSLAFFLLNPEAVRPSGRMPSLKLQAVEAADIAAYLLKDQDRLDPPTPPVEDPQLIAEGRRLFRELRCVNCHDTNDKADRNPAKPLAKLDRSADHSCFVAPRNGIPHYSLDPPQATAIHEVLATGKTAATDPLQLAMLQLNCYACHDRNEQGGVGRFRKPYFETVGHVDLGDEGRLPPPLTGVGRKLRQDWMKKVLNGNGDVRSHMHIRMPKFPPAAVKSLPAQFARADQAKPSSEKEVFGPPQDLTEAGRRLMDIGCVQCHQFRGETLPGTVGTDLAGITTRVDPQWFYEFLLNPGELKNRTRMPTFFPGGTSQDKELLGGDPKRQIAAMWTYLKGLDKLPLPEKIVQARSESFELIPRDRPIVLRTFMDEAGTHAIAVGFPEQVNFAFDAEAVRLAHAWRGGFLDALGTWFIRFAPPAHPLGDASMNLPAGVPLVILKTEKQPWPTGAADDNRYRFGGYKLDNDGIPTFLYRYGPFEIQDRIVPSDKQGLRRQLTIVNRHPDKSAPPVWFRANLGKSLKQQEPLAYKNDHGLTVTMPKELADSGQIRTSNKLSEWIVPIDVVKKTTIEVQYAW